MIDSSILDVAIGLIFVYLLLSLVTTSLTEGMANLVSARSLALKTWLTHILDDNWDGTRVVHGVARQMLDHPLVRGLRPRKGGGSAPDYLSAETFSSVLVEMLDPHPPRDGTPPRRPRSYAELEQRILALPPQSPLRRLLLNVITHAEGDLERAEHNIQQWFDTSMDRLSAWYARRAQLAAFVVAAILTWSLNADSLMIADALWQDGDLRATLATQAQAAATAEDPSEVFDAEDAAREVATLRSVAGFPLGWSSNPVDRRSVPESLGGWAMKILGFALTILATTLGAPFWFSLLKRVFNLRHSSSKARDGPARADPSDLIAALEHELEGPGETGETEAD